MKTRNRIFSIMLALMMVFAYMPALAFAEEPSDSEPLTNNSDEQINEEESGVLEEALSTEAEEKASEEAQSEENQENLPINDNKSIEKTRTSHAVSIADTKADINVDVCLGSGGSLSQESAVESGETVKYSFSIDAHGSVINSIGIWMHPKAGLYHDGLQEALNEYFFLNIVDKESYSSVDYSPNEGFFAGPDMTSFGTNPTTVSFELEIKPEIQDFWQVGVIEIYTADGDWMFVNKWYYPSEVTEDYGAVTTPENCDELIYRLYDVNDDCNFDSLSFWYDTNPNPSGITDRTKIAVDEVYPIIKGPFSVSTDSIEQRKPVKYCFKVKENDRLFYAKVFFENTATGEAAGSDIAEIDREEVEPEYDGYGDPIIDEDGFISYNCYTKFYKEGTFRVAYIEAEDMHGNKTVFKNTKSVSAGSMQADNGEDLDGLNITVAPYINTGEVHISGMNGKLVQLNEGSLEIEVTISDSQITGNIEDYNISLWLKNATKGKGDSLVFSSDDPEENCVAYDAEKDCYRFTTSGYGYNGAWYVSHLWVWAFDDNYNYVFEKAYVDERYEDITRHSDFGDNYEIMDFGAGSFNVGILDADSGVFATGAGLDEGAELSVENKGEEADFNAELLQNGYDWVASYTIEIDDQYLDDKAATTLYIPVDTDAYPDGTVLTIRHKLKSGEIQTVNSTVINGMVLIDVSECSPFLIEKRNGQAVDDLEQIKTDAKNELENYKSADLYREAQKLELQNAIEAGCAAIDAAETEEEVISALEAAKAVIDKIKTDAQLTEEEEAAKPKDVVDYSLPAVKNYKPTRSKTWIKARWKKLSKKNRKKVDGIEIQYSTSSAFTDGNTWTAKKTAKTKKIKGLARKTYYYTRVRTYKYVGGIKHVSKWSAVKKNKTK